MMNDNQLIEKRNSSALGVPFLAYDGSDNPPYASFKDFVNYINFLVEQGQDSRQEIADCVRVLQDGLNEHKLSLTHLEMAELGRCHEPRVISLALEILRERLAKEKKLTKTYSAIERFFASYLLHNAKEIDDKETRSDICNTLFDLLGALLKDVSGLSINEPEGVRSGLRALIPLTLVFCSSRFFMGRKQRDDWQAHEKTIKISVGKIKKHINSDSDDLSGALDMISQCFKDGVQLYKEMPLKKGVLAKDIIKAATPFGYAGNIVGGTIAGTILAVPTLGLSLVIPVIALTGGVCLLIRSVIDAGEIMSPYLVEAKWHMDRFKNKDASAILVPDIAFHVAEVSKINEFSPDEAFQWILSVAEILKATDFLPDSLDSGNVQTLLSAIATLLRDIKDESAWKSAAIKALCRVQFKNNESVIAKIQHQLNDKCKSDEYKNVLEFFEETVGEFNKSQRNQPPANPHFRNLESSWIKIFPNDIKIYDYFKKAKSLADNASEAVILKEDIENLLSVSSRVSLWANNLLISIYNVSLQDIPIILKLSLREYYRRQDFIRHIDPDYHYQLSDTSSVDVLGDDFFELEMIQEDKNKPLSVTWDNLFQKDGAQRYLLSAPSGAGKTTLIHHMLAKGLQLLADGKHPWVIGDKPVTDLILIKCKEIEDVEPKVILRKMFYRPFLGEDEVLHGEGNKLKNGIDALINSAIKAADTTVLLLDARDELNDANKAGLAKLLQAFPYHIISGRPGSLEVHQKHEELKYLKLALKEMSNENQIAYVNRYFYNPEDKTTADIIVKFLEKIKKKGGFPSGLPLCLDALCYVASDEKSRAAITGNRISIVNIYAKVIQKLFKWTHEVKQDSYNEFATYQLEWQFLRQLAFESLNPKHRLTKNSCQTIAKQCNIGDKEIKGLLESGLLIRHNDAYEFIHPQYEAFLAAYEFAVQLLANPSQTFAKLTEKYHDFFHGPIWEMTLALLFSPTPELPDLDTKKKKEQVLIDNILENINVRWTYRLPYNKKSRLEHEFDTYYLFDFYMHLLNAVLLVIKENDIVPQYEVLVNNLILTLLMQQERDRTLLLRTIQNHQSEIAIALIKRGADLSVKDNHDETPLHKAIFYGLTEVALALVKKQEVADLSIQDEDGQTPLHDCALYECTDIALALIEKGADLSTKNKYGNTQLDDIISYGLTEIALMSIEKGADLSEDNKQWLVDFWVAKEKNTSFTSSDSEDAIEISKNMTDEAARKLAGYLLKSFKKNACSLPVSNSLSVEASVRTFSADRLRLELTENELLLIHGDNSESRQNWDAQVQYLMDYLNSDVAALTLQQQGALFFIKNEARECAAENSLIYNKLSAWIQSIENEQQRRLGQISAPAKLSSKNLFTKSDNNSWQNKVGEAISRWEQAQIKQAIKESLIEDSAIGAIQARLEANVTAYGLSCHDVPRDGNCFFHAVFAQLPEGLRGQYHTAAAIREAAVNHIVEHIEHYRDFVDDTISIDQFINELYNNQEWADNVVILATSRILYCTIAIIRSDGAEPVVFHQEDSAGTLILGYEVGLHYQCLIRDDTIEAVKNLQTVIDRTEVDDGNPLLLNHGGHAANPISRSA